MKIGRFEDLEIWQEARELSKMIFKLTDVEPFCSDYKLKNQIKSSTGSIMDNIAEGFERGGNNEFKQFLSIAKGSCGETRSQAYRAFDYEYISEDEFNELHERSVILSKKIASFMTYLNKSHYQGTKYKP
jgi:four helix bundle protein